MSMMDILGVRFLTAEEREIRQQEQKAEEELDILKTALSGILKIDKELLTEEQIIAYRELIDE